MSNDLMSLFYFNKSNIKLVANVAARAYYDDPLFSCLIPNVSKKKYLSNFFAFGLRYALSYGEVYATSPNLEGIAAWLPPDKLYISTWQLIKHGLIPFIFKVGRECTKNLELFEDFCKEKHKQHINFPHWYLYNIAVDPIYQGKGYASKLLRPMLAKLDNQNLPCYLETQKEQNVSLYHHFGFEVIEKTKIPELNFDFWIMLRKSSK